MMLFTLVVLVAILSCGIYRSWERYFKRTSIVPVSVNYHFTRKCNYECGFCFHTAKSSFILPLPEAKRGLKLLKEAGMRKINFAGGEPFLYPSFMGKLLRYCKLELELESVSIVTNGSLVRSEFMRDYGQYIDILAVSCDSFNEATNIRIGRGKGAHLRNLEKLSQYCREYNIKFKINTVVNKYNFLEDMNQEISLMMPFRWKCFQVLVVEGENNSTKTIRDANPFTITDDEFSEFCTRHQQNPCFVPESNRAMKSSYLILDEHMCFLNKGVKEPTKSILEIGVEAALAEVYWDEVAFNSRGGIYDWKKLPKDTRVSALDW